MSAPTSRIPHKEAALALSEPDDRARAVGAANTLWYDGGRLLSTNTDVEGFTANLDACVPGWEQRAGEAVVLGAGGSARAVIYGLIERGIGKHPRGQSHAGAGAGAAARASAPAVQPAHWAALPHLLTRAGLAGQHHLARHDRPAAARDRSWAAAPRMPWWPIWSMPRWKRRCLAAARARGLATADGLGMLLHQAVRGFQLWFGVRPEVTPQLRAVVETDLARNKRNNGLRAGGLWPGRQCSCHERRHEPRRQFQGG